MFRYVFAGFVSIAASSALLAQFTGMPASAPVYRPFVPPTGMVLVNPTNFADVLRAYQWMAFYGSVSDEYYRRIAGSPTYRGSTPAMERSPAPEPQYIAADGPIATRPTQAQVTLEVPSLAQVWVEGRRQEFRGTAVRIVSPELTPGKTYAYSVRVTWTVGNEKVERLFELPVSAGDRKVMTIVGATK